MTLRDQSVQQLSIAGATLKQIRLSGKLTLKQLKYLQLVYPAGSTLCLHMSTIEWRLRDVHLVFPHIKSVCILYKAKAPCHDLEPLLCFTGLQQLHLVNVQCHHLSSVSELTELTSLCIQEDDTERFLIQQSAWAVDCMSTMHALQHLQTLGCPSTTCLQRLHLLVSLKLRGPIPPKAMTCLLQITRLECNMIAAPFASQLNSAQLQNTLHQIQSLTLLRRLCLKVKALSGLQHLSSLTNLTVLKLDTATASYTGLPDLRLTSALTSLTIRYRPRYNIKSQRVTVKDAYGFQTIDSVVKDTLLEFFDEIL